MFQVSTICFTLTSPALACSVVGHGRVRWRQHLCFSIKCPSKPRFPTKHGNIWFVPSTYSRNKPFWWLKTLHTVPQKLQSNNASFWPWTPAGVHVSHTNKLDECSRDAGCFGWDCDAAFSDLFLSKWLIHRWSQTLLLSQFVVVTQLVLPLRFLKAFHRFQLPRDRVVPWKRGN